MSPSAREEWHTGDACVLPLPDAAVNCCVTSPPYFALRDYDIPGQIGLEATPDEYVARLVTAFREVHRVLTDDGTLWVNIGDGYNNFRSQMGPGQALHGRDKLNGKPAPLSRRRGCDGMKEKDLIGIPWLLAFALRADGWYLRSDIIWHKPNPMPESVTDRPTKAHEYLFMFSKAQEYYYDASAIMEAGASGRRNRRSVWEVQVTPFRSAHFATMPPDLARPCILAGCPPGGVVLDPFGGAGTVPLVARQEGRGFVYNDLNPAYRVIAERRMLDCGATVRLFGAA